jgi:hypothetical protein
MKVQITEIMNLQHKFSLFFAPYKEVKQNEINEIFAHLGCHAV